MRTRKRWFKWLAIGTVLLFALIFAGGVLTMRKQIHQVLSDHDIQTSGEEDLDAGRIQLIKVPFNTAKLEVLVSASKKVSWSCRSVGNAPHPTMEAGVLNFNLDSLNLANCTIAIPLGLAAEFSGVNGHMDVRSPSDTMKISLVNGKVNIKLDPRRVYDVDVKVKNGLSDFFPRSSDKRAVRMRVNVVNGLVKQER